MKLILIFIIYIELTIAIQNVTIPRNFTRSRYSNRTRRSTTETSILDVTETISTTVVNKVTNKTTMKPVSTTPVTKSTTKLTTVAPVTNKPTKKLLVEKLEALFDSLTTTSKPKTSSNTTIQTSTTTIKTTKLPKLKLTTPQSTINTPECGEQIGENFPWIAVIVHTKPNVKNKRRTLSKGVLISNRHVLTTVSSIHNSHPFWVVSSVRLGDSPTWSSNALENIGNRSMTISVGVENIFQHQYKDIAIIKLAKNITFNEYIRPVCLPDDDNYNFRELYLHICKRSSSRSLTKIPVIRSVPVSPLSPQDCTIMFHRKQAAFTLEEFCAWDEVGDTCTGDIGGPLVGKLNGRYQVVGLNSYVHTKSDFIADDYPGIYTRVGSHLNWIKVILDHD